MAYHVSRYHRPRLSIFTPMNLESRGGYSAEQRKPPLNHCLPYRRTASERKNNKQSSSAMANKNEGWFTESSQAGSILIKRRWFGYQRFSPDTHAQTQYTYRKCETILFFARGSRGGYGRAVANVAFGYHPIRNKHKSSLLAQWSR